MTSYRSSNTPTIYAMPEKYASPVDFRSKPWQCIGPTKVGRRCYCKNGLENAEAKVQGLESLPRGSARDEYLKSFLVLCCCCIHDYRLEDQETCLGSLIRIYDAALKAAPQPLPPQMSASPSTAMLPKQSVKVEQSSNKSQNINKSKEVISSGDNGTNATSSHSMQLRSRVSNPNTQPRYNFRKYIPSKEIAVSDHLLFPEQHKHASYAAGAIYCFNIPSQRGYVKIGFTSKSTAGRIEEWRDSFPDASLLHEVNVAWPWHVEQLIHLELAVYRRHVRCHFCPIYHNEWFEMEFGAAIDVMNLWAALANKWSLFERGSGNLSAWWKDRVKVLRGEVTAATLTDIALAKDALAKPIKREDLGEPIPEDVSQWNTPGELLKPRTPLLASTIEFQKFETKTAKVSAVEVFVSEAPVAAEKQKSQAPVPMAGSTSCDTHDFILSAFSEFFTMLYGQEKHQQQSTALA